MRVSLTSAVLCGLLLWGAAGDLQAQIARAEILKDLVIDGKLDDWPNHLERYPIHNNYQCYGPTDLDDVDPATSDDFSPYFRVAYNPGENLIYVAVEARDENQVVGNNFDNTDGCEVFVHGPRNRGTGEPLQYVVVPGGYGSYVPGWSNPGLKDHNIGDTRTRVAFARRGDVTVYEWAIEVFDDIPHDPTRLTPGRAIGFDVVAVDFDNSGNEALFTWGPPMQGKYFHPNRLGILQLLGPDGSFNAVVTQPDMEKFDRDMDKFGEDMGKFGEDMGRFGQEIARLATGAAALGLEEAARELEREGLSDADLREARQALEAARHQLEAERHQLENMRHHALSQRRGENVAKTFARIFGAAFVILTIGLSIGLVAYIARRGSKKHPVQAEILDELAERLETVEQRLADTQEVMVALNEKYDRMEGGSRSSSEV